MIWRVVDWVEAGGRRVCEKPDGLSSLMHPDGMVRRMGCGSGGDCGKGKAVANAHDRASLPVVRARALLVELDAPPRLLRHVEFVNDAAGLLMAGMRRLGVPLNEDWVLLVLRCMTSARFAIQRNSAKQAAGVNVRARSCFLRAASTPIWRGFVFPMRIGRCPGYRSRSLSK